MFRTREVNGRTESEELKNGDIVQHFKKALVASDDPNAYLYKILFVARDTETDQLSVVYQALYGDHARYTRPMKMFLGKVDREKYPDAKQEYRFEKYKEPDDYTPSAVTEETELKDIFYSLHILNSLRRVGAETMDDLCYLLSMYDIKTVRGIGQKTAAEIENTIRKLGFSFPEPDTKERKQISYDSGLRELRLSLKTYKKLKEAGMRTVGDLCSITKTELLNFTSERILTEIQKALREHGLSLSPILHENKNKEILDSLIGRRIPIGNYEMEVKRAICKTKTGKFWYTNIPDRIRDKTGLHEVNFRCGTEKSNTVFCFLVDHVDGNVLIKEGYLDRL